MTYPDTSDMPFPVPPLPDSLVVSVDRGGKRALRANVHVFDWGLEHRNPDIDAAPSALEPVFNGALTSLRVPFVAMCAEKLATPALRWLLGCDGYNFTAYIQAADGAASLADGEACIISVSASEVAYHRGITELAYVPVDEATIEAVAAILEHKLRRARPHFFTT